MVAMRRIWLVNNAASGSNDEQALAACEAAFAQRGCTIEGRTVFPGDALPAAERLDREGFEVLAVFAGDGTINAVLSSLAGWSGAILILPGGTMNLLYHRLFADLALAEAIEAVANGHAEPSRPGIIASECGVAYAGLLAGPGTAWNEVREAMRRNAPLEVAGDAGAALAETLQGDFLACRDPALGRPQGYPLLLLTPLDDGIAVDAYHADGVAEFLEQAFALMRRQFREGPHDRLGKAVSVTLANVESGGFDVLLDGEPCSVEGAMQFTLEPSKVDLLAMVPDG